MFTYAIYLLTYAQICNTLNFEPLDQKAGITFVKLSKARISYDTYTILYHIDISQYKNITKTIDIYLNHANMECEKIESKTCKAMLDQAQILLSHMKRDESDIEAYQQKTLYRERRALESIGNFYHWAFGLMNAEAAREYDRKIENLQNDSGRFHNLLEEQTILVKESLITNNKTLARLEDHMEKMTKKVKFYLTSVYDHLNWFQAESSITESVTLMKMLESEHKRLTAQILRSLEEIITGKINQLIPKEKITIDLLEINKYLKEEQKLPINLLTENPLHIFKYSQISSTLYGTKILMEVKIPIIERGKYTAYEIIPIPTKINSSMIIIKPTTRYVLLNDGKKEFIPISSAEYAESGYNLKRERIIKPAENAIIDYSNSCEITIFMQPIISVLDKLCRIKQIPMSNYFIAINSNDKYYLRITKPLMVTEYCTHRPAQTIEIIESGLLTLTGDCRIVTDKLSLRPRINHNYESKELIKLSNHSTELTFRSITKKLISFHNMSSPQMNENFVIQDSSIDFDNLINKANRLIEKSKAEKEWEKLNRDSTFNTQKSYAFTTIMATVIIVLILIIIWYIYKKFFQVDTWIRLAGTLSKNDAHRVPKLFIRHEHL